MGEIILLRHGQASIRAEDYDNLSETGVRQAGVLGAALAARGVRADAIWCGTLRRHRQTAEACLGAMGLPPRWQEDAGWDEYDHRDLLRAYDPRYADRDAMLADLSASEDPMRAFQRLYAGVLDRWVEGALDADYPVTWAAFCARVEGALGRARDAVGRDGRAIVFTSGGPIAAACRSLLQIPDKPAMRLAWEIANASITTVVAGARRTRLKSLNEHGHFAGAHADLLTFR